jgi:hypothetical protein
MDKKQIIKEVEMLLEKIRLQEVKEPMGFVPEIEERFWSINSIGSLDMDTFDKEPYQKHQIAFNNCFKSIEQAQDCLDNYIKPAFIKYWEDQRKI